MIFHDEKSGRGVNLGWACSGKHDAGSGKTTLYMSAGQANAPKYFGAEEGGRELWQMVKEMDGVLVVGQRALFMNQVVDWRIEQATSLLKVFTVNTVEVFGAQEQGAVLKGLIGE